MKFNTHKKYTLADFFGATTYKLKGLVFEPVGNDNDKMYADVITDIDGYPIGFVDSKHYNSNWSVNFGSMRETKEPKRYQVVYNTEVEPTYRVSEAIYTSLDNFMHEWNMYNSASIKNATLLK